jgi:hypothetical protein
MLPKYFVEARTAARAPTRPRATALLALDVVRDLPPSPGLSLYLRTIRGLSAFRDRGVPGPTSKLSPRAPAQMGRCETEREGGKAAGGRRA